MLAAEGCDPLRGLARIGLRAERPGKDHSLKLAAWCYAELAGYIEPKRKAIEVSKADGKGDFTLAELLATMRGGVDGS